MGSEFDSGPVQYYYIMIGYYHREIGHEIISTIIHLLPLIQEGFFQLQVKV